GSGANVFLRDMISEQTILVSRTASGSPADGDSWAPRITLDGRWAVFLSRNGSILAPGSSFFVPQVLARDMVSNRTYLVSSDPFTGGPSFASSFRFALSGGGRYVAFGTSQTATSPPKVYLHDLITHSNALV